MNKLHAITIAALLSTSVFANLQDPTPHFYVEMQNKSQKNASISFQPVIGNVSLAPVLEAHTPLLANETSIRYAVYFDPLTPEDTFNIIFSGKNDCAFNVAYFAPGDPKITLSGYGCAGGGYQIIDNGQTLLLYISDIHL